MKVLDWLIENLSPVPSIEGRNLSVASKSEVRRQLQNRVWTISGFRRTSAASCGGILIEDLEPIDWFRPGPDDEMPDVIAEVAMAKGSKSQRSFWYDKTLAEGVLSSWDEKTQAKYLRVPNCIPSA